MGFRCVWAGVPLALFCGHALAQPAPAEAAIPAVQQQLTPRAVANQPVILEVAEPISSKAQKRGDTFAIRLAAPIVANGQVLVPAGAMGRGQVVDAAAAGPLGRPAKLVLAARYLEVNGAQLPLRAFHLGSAGTDNTNAIMAASFIPYVGIFAGFVKGGEIIIPAGALGQAKLGADYPPAATASPAVTPAVASPVITPSPPQQ